MLRRLKKEIAYFLGFHFPIRIRRGLAQGMRLYGNIFYNRLPAELDHGDLFFAHLALENACVIEVGAHLGEYTMFFSRRVADGRVVAIEPNPVNFRILQKNLHANRCHNVQAVCAGMADREGEALFISDKFNRAKGSFDQAHQAKITGRSDSTVLAGLVRTTTVDRIVIESGLSKVDLVKIDTEGYEVPVLTGMRTTCEKMKPVILFEMHGTPEEKKRDFAIIHRFLSERSYSVYTLSHGVTPVAAGSEEPFGDGAFVAFVEDKLGFRHAADTVRRMSFAAR